jgi:hypothetical protein
MHPWPRFIYLPGKAHGIERFLFSQGFHQIHRLSKKAFRHKALLLKTERRVCGLLPLPGTGQGSHNSSQEQSG